jgi:SAM-dependent methyltransferase
MRCYACKTGEAVLLYDKLPTNEDLGRTYSGYKCTSCTAGFLFPRITYEEIEESCYGDDYHIYRPNQRRGGAFGRLKLKVRKAVLDHFLGYGERHWYAPLFYSFFLRVAFYPRRHDDTHGAGKVLDIGCGSGKYLSYLKELGWDVYGIEPSHRGVSIAHASGLSNVVEGNGSNIPFPDKTFDVINMHHVFEHVDDPDPTLQAIHHALKDNGELVITVPNFNSLASRVFGRYWGGIDLPRHFFYYNVPSLQKILAKHGFQIRETYFSDTFRGFASALSCLLTNDMRSSLEKYFLPFGVGLDLLFDPLFRLWGLGDAMTIKAVKIHEHRNHSS